MKRGYAKITAIVLCVMLLAGCGAGTSTATTAGKTTAAGTTAAAGTTTAAGGTTATTKATKATTKAAAGAKEVIYWNIYTGSQDAALDKIVNAFNESQKKYALVSIYQGSFTESQAKYNATAKSDLPDMFVASTEQTGYFRDYKTYVPVQNFIDAEKYDMSKFHANLLAAYSYKGQLMAMPFGNTLAGIMYNADILKKAGVDPLTDLEDFSKVQAAVEKIAKSGASKYAFACDKSGVYLNFALAAEGVKTTDQNNGFDGVPTKSLYNEGSTKTATVNYFTAFKNIWSKGYAFQLGPWADIVKALAAKELAMTVCTIAGYGTIQTAAEWKLNLGFAPMPKISSGGNGGQAVGGTAMWISDNGDTDGQKGAWEFIKYYAQPENQSSWSTATGYPPISMDGVNTASYQKYAKEKFPTVTVAIDTLNKSNPGNLNAVVPIANEFKDAGLKALEKLVSDASYTPEKAAADMAAAIDEAFSLYHQSQKK